jgi:hypothetical protein
MPHPPSVTILEGLCEKSVEKLGWKLSALGCVVMPEYFMDLPESYPQCDEGKLTEQFMNEWEARVLQTMQENPGRDIFVLRGPLTSCHFASAQHRVPILRRYKQIRAKFSRWYIVHVQPEVVLQTGSSSIYDSHSTATLTPDELKRVQSNFNNYKDWDMTVSTLTDASARLVIQTSKGGGSGKGAAMLAPSSSKSSLLSTTK